MTDGMIHDSKFILITSNGEVIGTQIKEIISQPIYDINFSYRFRRSQAENQSGVFKFKSHFHCLVSMYSSVRLCDMIKILPEMGII